MSEALTIIVSGGSGYIGSHLIHALSKSEHQIIALCHKTEINIENVSVVSVSEFSFDTFGDELKKVCKHKPLLVHLATNYGRNLTQTVDVVRTNILLPLQMLDWGIQNNASGFINTDTYFNVPNIQTDYLAAYSQSKADFLRWAELRCRNSALRFLNLRLEHVFGPHDSPDKFVNSFIRRLLMNQTMIPMTLGNQLRDFVFVSDVVRAYTLVIEKISQIPGGRHDFQVGSGLPTSVRSFANLAKQLSESISTLQFGAIPYRQDEIMLSVADTVSLTSLGWSAEISLEQALVQTINSERSRLDVN